jgi:diguanylate cyclase (GGDEF)-like protein/PAS domain S-box-containing protein
MRRYGWKSLLATWALLAAVFASGESEFHQWVFHVATGGASAFVVVGIRRHRPAYRTPWILFATGTGLVTVAALLVHVLALPAPSPADGLFAGGYLCTVAGLLLLAGRKLAGGMLVAVVDGLAGVLCAGVVAWTFVLSRYADADAVPAAMRVMVVSLPLTDLLLVALCARILWLRETRNAAQWLIAASVGALLLTDSVNTPAALHGYHEPSRLVAVGWLVTFAFMAASALHPAMADDARATESHAFPRARLAAFSLAVLTVPVVALVEDVRGAGVDVSLFAAVVTVLAFLMLVRLGHTLAVMVGALRQVTADERRRRQLADASASLVAATSPEDLYAALVRGAWSIAGGRADDAAAVHVPYGRSRLTVAVAGTPRDDYADAAFTAPIGQSGAVLSVTGALGAETAETLRTLADGARLALDSVQTITTRERESGERMFHALVASSTDAISVVGSDLSLRFQSPAVARLFGLAGRVTAAQVKELIHPDDLADARKALEKVAIAPNGASTVLECRLLHRDGTWRGAEATLTNLVQDPDVQGIVINARDVTERRALEEQLVRQALHDGLTDLPNRTLFVDRVSHALLRRRERSGGDLAVLFVDLDEFKVVNDSLGHPVGDRLLREVGLRLVPCARDGDTVARLGGDEFAILVEGPDAALTATALAERVLDALAPGIEIDGELLVVGASIGIAVLGAGPAGADELLRDADLAMYVAKRSGKNCYELYDPSMYEAAVRRRQLSAELRTAIDEDQLVVHYQPIVDLRGTRAVGVEALVRWLHPTRGMVSPAEFIPLAEETGLVVDLGRVVLRQACADVAAWRSAGVVDDDLYVTVNLSARHLAQDSLVGDVSGALRGAGLPAANLVLEVTETTVMHDVDLTSARLAELKALGVRVAVDDFGTGFSSLSYLSRFDVDVLKVDKSFVDRLTTHDDGAVLVRAVVDLAGALGLRTVAEGIETVEQLRVLEELGCGYGQGYYFARPMPASAVAELLAQADAYFGPLAVS